MRKRWVVLFTLIVMASGWAWVDEGFASRPAKRTLTGCVIDGRFYAVRQSYSSPRHHSTIVHRISVRNVDLFPFEGRKIQMRGRLYQGDRFRADPGSIRVLGPCDRRSRRAIRHQGF